MAALTYRTSVTGGTASANTSSGVAITPVIGDAFIVATVTAGASWSAATRTLVDNNSGTYTSIGHINFIGGYVEIWSRDQFLPSTTPTTVTYNPNDVAATGTSFAVTAVSSAGATGLALIKQFAAANGASGTTPATTFSTAPLSTSMCISMVGDLTNPPNITATTLWTRQQDVGQATPIGLDTETVNSGFINSTVTWGSTSASNWGTISIELNGVAHNGIDMSGLTGPNYYPRSRGYNPQKYNSYAGSLADTRHPMQIVTAYQSTAINLSVFLRDTTTNTGVPGLASFLTVFLSKNGGSFSTITPAVTDLGNGWYNLALTSAHTNTLGIAQLRITASSGVAGAPAAQENNEYALKVVAVNDQDPLWGMFPSGAVVSNGANLSTSFSTNLTQIIADYWKNSFIVFASGALKGQVKQVTGFTVSGAFLSFASPGFTGTPIAGDAFYIINA